MEFPEFSLRNVNEKAESVVESSMELVEADAADVDIWEVSIMLDIALSWLILEADGSRKSLEDWKKDVWLLKNAGLDSSSRFSRRISRRALASSA